jgi:hypothetical protein
MLQHMIYCLIKINPVYGDSGSDTALLNFNLQGLLHATFSYNEPVVILESEKLSCPGYRNHG